jgi:hypothetical protein
MRSSQYKDNGDVVVVVVVVRGGMGLGNSLYYHRDAIKLNADMPVKVESNC